MTMHVPSHYVKRLRSLSYLTTEEEFLLAKKAKEQDNKAAKDELVNKHLALVMKIANGYRGYGLPLSDVISQGNIGLLYALKHFDPDKGFRFSTYAMWWIKSTINDYIMSAFSLVKIGTTKSQRKLFFNLKKLNTVSQNGDDELGLSDEKAEAIAKKLEVEKEEVFEMYQRLRGHDHSLNATISEQNEGESEWQDWLQDPRHNPEEEILFVDEYQKRKKIFEQALDVLSQKEHDIFFKRRLHEPNLTLEELANEYNVSRERIRQIEMKAFDKIQKRIRSILNEQNSPNGTPLSIILFYTLKLPYTHYLTV